MLKLRLGVRARLWAAFAVIVVLLVICSAVSWLAFERFDAALGVVVDDKLPRIESSLNLVRQGDRIAYAGSGLANAISSDNRRAQSAALAQEMEQAEALLAKLRGSGESTQSEAVTIALAQVRDNLKQIDVLVGEALERQGRLADHQKLATRLGEEFAAALQPLASEQRNALVGFIAILNSASASADRRLAADNGIQKIADALRAFGRMSAASATLQSAFARIPLTLETASLDRLGQAIRRESEPLLSDRTSVV